MESLDVSEFHSSLGRKGTDFALQPDVFLNVYALDFSISVS